MFSSTLNRFLIAILVLAAMMLCAPAAKNARSAKPFTEPKTQIAFPSQLCGMNKTAPEANPASDQIIAIHYQNDDTRFSASYTIDGSASFVMSGSEDEAVKAAMVRTLEGIRDMEKLGRYGSVSIQRQETIPIDIKDISQDALLAQFEYTDGDQTKAGYLLVTAHNNQIIKIRFSFPAIRKDQADEAWDCLLKSLQ